MVFRLRLDREAGRLVIDERWRPRYGPAPGRSYGWDPVITDEHVLWMDNGRNRVDRTMVGSGDQSEPVRLWWARRDDGSVRSTEISGLPFGTESNPPAWDPGRADRRRLRRRQRGRSRLADGRRRARAAVAPRRPRPRRPPDRLSRTRGSWSSATGRDVEALRRPLDPTGRSSRRSAARAIAGGPPSLAAHRPRPARRARPRHAARRRPASTCRPPPRRSSSPRPASAATSTTSR